MVHLAFVSLLTRGPELALKALDSHFLRRQLFGDGSQPKPSEIQELSVFTPPVFALRIFSVYSPVVALLVQFMDRTTFLSYSLAILILTAQIWYVVQVFQQTLKDKQIINQQVFNEYDRKFVNPRINYSRRDVAVQTNQAEFIDRSEWETPTSSYKPNGRMPRSSTSGALSRRY